MNAAASHFGDRRGDSCRGTAQVVVCQAASGALPSAMGAASAGARRCALSAFAEEHKYAARPNVDAESNCAECDRFSVALNGQSPPPG